MNLSSELISQFVKVTKDEKPVDNGSTVYGTIVERDGKRYVKLDGSDQITPITSTSDAIPGDRVSVLIKNHTATVTGNITSPAARTDDLKSVGARVDEFDHMLADTVTTEQLTAMQANIDLVLAKKIEAAEFEAYKAEVGELVADKATVGDLEAIRGDFEELEAKTLTTDYVDANFAKISDLNATNATVNTLETTFVTVNGRLEAVEADIENLDVESLDAKYANTVFSNIEEAAVRKIFGGTGLIDNLTIGEGMVAGKLVGVTISGDYIEGNTIKADKLVVKGKDGLYYKLNVDAGATSSEEVTEEDLQNGLHGTAIIAKTITAEKISVDDIVAFDATIGGFNLTTESIYSGVKKSINNSTRGLYMDNEGQLSLGDAHNYLRYLRVLKCTITGEPIKVVDPAPYGDRYVWTDSEDRILYEVVDGVGVPVYCADINGTYYSVEVEETYKLEIAAESIRFGSSGKNGTLEDMKDLAEYVQIGTWVDSDTNEEKPCIDLTEDDSNYRQIITNTASMIVEGENVIAKMGTDGVEAETVTIKGSNGSWVWAARSTGNLGLMWKGASD